ncbi:26S proteasome regulatory subunit 7-like [Biomphalaria glabrata]|uniref:26S proteasome regulatory subunit 7-like n=1 Tax=Biomphalaria glabrata TaxID=6526 RepID=A0A9W3AGY7_BIOGL|nr:26S proteasome regulatory subunit 7-like [Biomphalaria glabrata]
MRRKKKEDWKQHGYQKAETIQTSLDGEFYFVGKVLGFEPAEKHRKGRTHICKIHARSMSVEKDIHYELLARLCPNSTGAEIRSVGTKAGMFAIRVHRKMATEKDFLEAVNKVIKAYAKSSATPCYMTYNEINSSLIEMATRESVHTCVYSLI